MRNTGEIWMLIVGLLAALAAAAGINVLVLQFMPMMENFGAEVPVFTRLFIDGRAFFWALPLIVLAIWAFIPRRTVPPDNKRGIVAMLAGIGLAVILLPLCLLAMYLPVFTLASTIDGG